MTGIDELRRTLEIHARGVHDDAVPGRADAARTRARQARRQRMVGTASITVVAVLAAVALSFWPSQDRPVPADRVLNGHEAPATLKSLGYTYRYVRGVEGTDEHAARIGLGAAAAPRLVTWAADGESVRVTGTDGRVLGTEATEFGDFALLPAHSDGAFRVRGENAALAVYELTDQAPPGVTVAGITYRDTVGSDRLVAAEIGDVGQSELTFDFEIPQGQLRADILCTGGDDRTRVRLELGDDGGVSTSGCDDDTFDPGGGSGFGYPDGVGARPGETVTARLSVTDGENGEPVSGDRLRIGVGLYAQETRPEWQIGSYDVPLLQEQGGHLWRLFSLAPSNPGDRRASVEAPGPAPELVYFYVAHAGSTTVRTTFNGVETSSSSGIGDAAGPVLEPPATSGTYAVHLGKNASPGARLLLVTYERMD